EVCDVSISVCECVCVCVCDILRGVPEDEVCDVSISVCEWVCVCVPSAEGCLRPKSVTSETKGVGVGELSVCLFVSLYKNVSVCVCVCVGFTEVRRVCICQCRWKCVSIFICCV